MRFVLTLLLASVSVVPQCASADESPAAAPEQLKFVRSKVLPLLEARCFQCHKDVSDHRGGLLLTSRRAMLRGGDSGPAIVPGKPNESLLIEAIRYEGFEMPPRNRMPQAEIDLLVRWVAEGAVWPAELDTAPDAEAPAFPLEERRASHWAWQHIEDPDVPPAGDWGRDPLDGFVLKQLQQADLKPAGDADRYTLIRRLYFDLIGLPPTVSQIKRFVNDPADDDAAIAAVVDELLQSPHFGERWGRHWLDLVRYAETLGHEFDYPLHHAWQYRDYVIRAFNEDVPYDQLLLEHVAGDLLPSPRRHPEQKFNESIIGTGFWFLHEDKHAPVDVRAEEAAKIDNQIDVFSKTFLGLTVACARCHDHKFDAISTRDYYALAGFLQSSRRQTARLDPHQKIGTRLDKLQEHRQRVLASVQQSPVSVDQLTNYVAAAIEVIRQSTPDRSPSADAARSADERPADDSASPAEIDDRVLQKIVEQKQLSEPLLRRWVQMLREPEQAEPRDPLSLPATLAQHKHGRTALNSWRQTVQPPESDTATTLFADLRNGLPSGWFTRGHAFAGAAEDQLAVSVDAGKLRWSSQSGVNSARLSHGLHGAVASPTFELNADEILVKVAGRGCRMRLVIDGYEMFEFSGLLFNGVKQKIDTDGEYRWLRFSGDTHRYRGHRAYIEFLDEGDGWFDVQEIRFAESGGQKPPQPEPAALNLTLARTIDANITLDAAIRKWATAAVQRAQITDALILEGLLPHAEPADRRTAEKAWMQEASGIPKPMPVIAMTEGTPENEVVFIRGNHKNPGEVAERQILTALRTEPKPPAFDGSGRLQLAQQLTSPDNPLVARVAVNRIWHHLFGRGIVASTDNFGVLGKRPSHPQLLDHLATRFRTEGWSFKKMIKAITLSRAYRLSSQRSPAAEAADPANVLLHRANIRRLQGEAVRDAILKVSGRLDAKQFGPPIPIRLNAFLQGRGRPKQNGPVDGAGRRSIYLSVYRNFLNPFMQAFDVPAPVTTTGRRTISNVPAQALILLNNEFVNQQSRIWAAQLIEHHSPKTAQHVIAAAWFELLGRPAEDSELKPLLDYAGGGASEITLTTLSEICHVLLNSKEFLFLK